MINLVIRLSRVEDLVLVVWIWKNIFSQFGDIFGSAFGGFGGFGGSGRSRTSKGTNLRIKVSLTIDEIANGTNKKNKS